MGLVNKIFVKVSSGQDWLYYQSCYDYGFLLSRIKYGNKGQYPGQVKYTCYGLAENIRYKYAEIREKINHVIMSSSYHPYFVIAETEFAIPMNQKERERLKKKIEELE